MKKLIIAIVLLATFIGCNGPRQKSSVATNDRLLGYPAPQDIKEDPKILEISGTKKNIPDIVKAIVNKDPVVLSQLTAFPIERVYPLKSIETPEQLEEYFDTLFDDAFIEELKKSSLDDWHSAGWRGYTYGNGKIWVYDYLIGVTYSSAKEQALLRELIDIDKESTSLDMEKWTPCDCFTEVSGAFIVRLDKSDEDMFRLSIFNRGTSLSAMPDVIMYGTETIEGSMANRFFEFSSEDKKSSISFILCAYDDSDISLEWNRNNKIKEYLIKPKRDQ